MSNRIIKSFIWIVLLFSGSLVYAASFDCSIAKLPVEQLVCGDQELSSLDDHLTDIYKKVHSNNPNIKKSQLEWFKQRNICQDIECVRNAYIDRTGLLEGEINTLQSPIEDTDQNISNANTLKSESNVIVPAIANTPDTSISTPKLTKSTDGVDLNQHPQNMRELVEPQEGGEISTELAAKNEQLKTWVSEHQLIWIIICLSVVILIYGFIKRCPSCHSWFSVSKTNDELLDSQSSWKTVKRKDKHKDEYGQIIKIVERNERIQVTDLKRKAHYQCKKCNHAWTKVYSVREGDEDDDS